MGSAPSKVADELSNYVALWESRDVKGTQTETLRRLESEGSLGKCDFTQPFKENQLENLFTSDKVQLSMQGPYNCNHLFRDSKGEPVIPLYSDDNYVVLHPLGEPGRDLGEGHSSKGSHQIIMKYGSDGPITMNEMLPTTLEEDKDLEERLRILNLSFTNVKDNVPLSKCGKKVMDKATAIGVDHGTGIRDFLIMMIEDLTDEFRSSRPGYKLIGVDGTDVSGDTASVKEMIEGVYSDDSLKVFAAIQPPSENSQLLSHVHGFLVKEVPECMSGTYVDCHDILQTKNDYRGVERIPYVEDDDEGDDALSRQSSVYQGCS